MALEKGDGKDSIYTNLTVQPSEESAFGEIVWNFVTLRLILKDAILDSILRL